jgi:hypothetical protein
MRDEEAAGGSETSDPEDELMRSTETLGLVRRELTAWVPILRRIAEASALRNLAHGCSFEIDSTTLRTVIAARRLRDDYFWPGMEEGAWSLLLELMANRLDGRRPDAVALSDAIGLPVDSTLHWIDASAARGFVTRRYADAEWAPVELTDRGADRMRAYLLASLTLSPWAQ